MAHRRLPGPGAPQSRCSACRAGREPHLSVAFGNFRISTFCVEITPGGGPNLKAEAAGPVTLRLAWHAGRGARGGCGPTAELPSGCPDRRRALPGALTSSRKERGRMTRRPLSEAGNSICPKLRGCQGLRARAGNTRLPPAPRSWRGREINPGILCARPY
ncbi:uncharacterized protein C9orf66 homolog [Sus scrofa]|uniref:uncharacterized protein C9orf66 homolog n=1 Tax=Sus scrofa TaxID=9823 RepID=UPI000A2B8FF5|nr:uncharacterized protein C9orf66 homolog [Sus scrofa]